MGTDSTENVEAVSNVHSFKVHCRMCTELMKLVDRVSEILPKIEEARPGSPEGREALCNLNNGKKKAELLLQYCRDSSKLYLALTGDKIIAKCQRVRTLLEHNLRKIKYMVPVALARKISQIADDLRVAKFILDSSEEEAWQAMRQWLKLLGASPPDPLENSEIIKALKIAALRLNISSSKEMLYERRSIRKLLDEVGHGDQPKKKILTFLHLLLKKHGELILQEIREAGYGEVEVNVRQRNNASQADIILNRAIPPEEFKCPISMRLMYDPVVIASGSTFEKVWIEKWFEEGHDTCPQSKLKLTNFSMTPNVDIKNLIDKWCVKFRVTIPDPSVEPECPEVWENSIASFGSSMNDIRLPLDFSNISFGGLDSSYYPDSLRLKGGNALAIKSGQSKDDDLQRFQSDSNAEETDLELPSTISELSWESKCKVIKDMKIAINKSAVGPTLSETVMDQLALFLKDACDQQDSEAQKNGSELFLTLVRRSRSNRLSVPEKVLTTLASLLNSEVTYEVLAILEALSGHRKCGTNFVTSGVLASMAKYLDSVIEGFQDFSIKTFYNLSSNSDICSDIVSLGCIPKLVPLLNYENLSGKCIYILKNLCHTEEARISITGTNGCITSIAQRLGMGCLEDQENAVTILLSLCSQRVEYCELVMEEGVIPPLCTISMKGSEKGKAGATELLRLLRDVQDNEQQESRVYEPPPSSYEPPCNSEQRKASKKSGFLGMNISIFSKRSPLKKK